MHVSAFALAALVVIADGQAPAQRYAPGQDVRICGEVVAKRTTQATCETALVVKSAGEDVNVVIPASIRKDMSIAPERLRGAVACFTGKVANPSPLQVTAAAVDVTAAPADANFGVEAVTLCSGSVTLPRVLQDKKPQYTTKAMRERAQGSVEVEAVVNTEGTVDEARVVKALHPELDEQALLAVKAWKFAPGTKDGKPVPVLVDIEMTFALSSRRQ